MALEAYRARMVITTRDQGGVSLFVEPSDGVASGDCDWRWEFRNVEKWNPFTRNEMRLYYYEFDGSAWRFDPDNQPPCVVVICPKYTA